VSIQRVDEDQRNVLKEYAATGQPLDPTPDQVGELNHRTALLPPVDARLQGGKIWLSLAPNTLALKKVNPEFSTLV